MALKSQKIKRRLLSNSRFVGPFKVGVCTSALTALGFWVTSTIVIVIIIATIIVLLEILSKPKDIEIITLVKALLHEFDANIDEYTLKIYLPH